MKTEQIFDVSEDELLDWFKRDVAPHVGLSFSATQNELQRRATLRLIETVGAQTEATRALTKSSQQLERFTRWLIVLTILLLIAAAPPAVEALATWLG